MDLRLGAYRAGYLSILWAEFNLHGWCPAFFYPFTPAKIRSRSLASSKRPNQWVV